MSTMVSARVPSELVAQVNDSLARENKTTTEFIRAAYEHYARFQVFPQVPAPSHDSQRILSPEQREELSSLFHASSLPLQVNPDIAADKAALADAKVGKYEALG